MSDPGHVGDDRRAARSVAHARATKFFQWVLVVASLFSIGGNAGHAVLNATGAPLALAAVVATAPPLVLLASAEGVSLLLKVRRQSSLIYWFAVLLTALLAFGAFYLSFDALRELGMRCGFPVSKAFVLPLVIDFSILQATVALFALSRIPAPPADVDSRTPAVNSAAATNGHLDGAAGARLRERDLASDAAALVEARIAPKKGPEFVEAVLRHHAEGKKVGEIAEALEAHHSTVARVLAAHLQRTKLTPAGSAPLATGGRPE